MGAILRRALSALGWWDALAGKGPSRVLALNALVDAAGTGLALVCLPFFAVTQAGLKPGELALTLSVMGGCELLAAVPNGAAAGRLGVQRFVVVAKLIQAAAYIGLAFTHGLAQFLPVAAAVGVARASGNGLNQSLTATVLGEGERAGALGTIRALRNIGYLAAGSLGGLVLGSGSALGLRLALVANGVSFLMGAWWVSRLRVGARVEGPRRTDWSVLRDLEYFGLIACASVFGSSLVVLQLGLPLWTLHRHGLPSWTVAAAIVVNTLLVVVLQYRFSNRTDTTSRARRAIRYSASAFCAMAVLLAASGVGPVYLAVPLTLLAAVALTLGELLESPAWWTLSFELAPADRRSEYLAAFDISWALVGIVGPAAMAGVVAAGSTGWLLYGGVLLVAAGCGTRLARTREQRAQAPGPAAPVGVGAGESA